MGELTANPAGLIFLVVFHETFPAYLSSVFPRLSLSVAQLICPLHFLPLCMSHPGMFVRLVPGHFQGRSGSQTADTWDPCNRPHRKYRRNLCNTQKQQSQATEKSISRTNRCHIRHAHSRPQYTWKQTDGLGRRYTKYPPGQAFTSTLAFHWQQLLLKLAQTGRVMMPSWSFGWLPLSQMGACVPQ